jgi:PKD repeat protein
MGAGVVVLLLAVWCGSAGAITVTITEPTEEAEYDWKINAQVDFDCEVGDIPGPGELDYDWDLGYSSSEEKSPDYTYEDAATVTVTLTVTFSPEGEGEEEEDDDTLTIYVIGGDVQLDLGTKDLRYYGGEPVDYHYEAECSIPGDQPEGTTITWTVSDKLRITEGQGTQQVEISADGHSAAPDDQTVTCTCSKGTVTYQDTDEDYESLEPCYAVVYVFTDEEYGGGFKSTYFLIMYDQYPLAMGDCDYNVKYGAWIDDEENDWDTPASVADQTGEDGEFEVAYTQESEGQNPDPEPPGDPLGADKVKHAQAKYRGGSQGPGLGCVVRVKLAQFYLDHATEKPVP